MFNNNLAVRILSRPKKDGTGSGVLGDKDGDYLKNLAGVFVCQASKKVFFRPNYLLSSTPFKICRQFDLIFWYWNSFVFHICHNNIQYRIQFSYIYRPLAKWHKTLIIKVREGKISKRRLCVLHFA